MLKEKREHVQNKEEKSVFFKKKEKKIPIFIYSTIKDKNVTVSLKSSEKAVLNALKSRKMTKNELIKEIPDYTSETVIEL